MPGQAQFTFSVRDYAILRGIAVHRPQGLLGYFSLLNDKLAAGTVVEERDMPPGIVRLDSVVRYRINDDAALEHQLVIGPAREVLGRTVSVRSLHGLALIGLAAGQVVELPEPNGGSTRITLEAVLAQPERLLPARRPGTMQR